MTQTPREWKKDMEMCEAATPGPWTDEENESMWMLFGGHMGAMQLIKAPKRSTPFAEYWPEAEDALFIKESRTAMPHWLQEAKRLEGLNESCKANFEYQKARADAAEAREQRLKEAAELLLFMFRFDPEKGRAYINFGDYEQPLEDDDNSAYIAASSIFSTLYPDTPAPTKEDLK